MTTSFRDSTAPMISELASVKLGLFIDAIFLVRKTHGKDTGISALPLPQDPSQLVEYYDSLSSSYDQLYGKEQSRKHQLVLTMLGNRYWTILADVGCGTGSLMANLGDNCGQLVGTDVSLGMLKTARDKLGPNPVDLLRAHSSWLPFRSRVCDGVLSVSVFTGENLERQVSELLRITRPGGTAVFTILASEDSEDWLHLGLNVVVQQMPVSPRETLHIIHLQDPEHCVR